MTQEIQWGPAIAVDGKRPEWLTNGERMLAIWKAGRDGVAIQSMPGAWNAGLLSAEDQWGNITHVILPADHPRYRQTEEAPIDWSGELEAVHEDGRVVPAMSRMSRMVSGREMRWVCWPDNAGLVDSVTGLSEDHPGWRIRNVPQPTPQADTKPDLTARMEALVRRVAKAGPSPSYDEGMAIATEACVIEKTLLKPVDPVEAIVDELMRKDCTTRQAIEEAVHRGRALALAGEKET